MGYSNRGYLYNDLEFDYFDSYQYRVQEYIYDTKPLSKEEAIDNAVMIMADQSFIDEIDRIYADSSCTSRDMIFGAIISWQMDF